MKNSNLYLSKGELSMKQKKKFSKKFSLLTMVMLLMSIISSQVYAAKLPFTDVPEKAWYYDDVKSAYESNLINGKKPTKYAPDDNMTAAEAVKLAAAMHKLKNEGKVDFSSSTPWYKVYVDYAKQKNLITDDLDWNRNITRAGYMQIFAQILTDEEAKKNNVADGSIPDVPMTHPSSKAIYKLYRAGVVVGVDDKKNCSPASNIKRSEVAAILIRMMDVKRRVEFSLGATTPGTGTTPGGSTPQIKIPKPEVKPFKISKHPENVIGNLGDTVVLEVVVEGGKEPYSYQWEEKLFTNANYKKSAAKGNTTSILKPNIADSPFDYRCVIIDANGDRLTTNPARVEINPITNPLKITKQPNDIKGVVGEVVTVEIRAEGGKAPLSYQWEYSNDADPEFKKSDDFGNTRDVLTPNVKPEVSFYRCVVTDANGNKVTSNTAKVEVDPRVNPLKIVSHPQSVTGNVGDSVTLEVIATGGTPPYRYQWRYRKVGDVEFIESPLPGNQTNTLNVTIENDAYEYFCAVIDAKESGVTSFAAKVEKTSP